MPNLDEPAATPEHQFASANRSVACFLAAPLGVRWYHALLSAAENGLATDLFLPESLVASLGIAEPYLARFRAAGGRCFLLHLKPQDWQRLRLAPRNLLLIDEAGTPRIIGEAIGATAEETDWACHVFKQLRSFGRLDDQDTLTAYLTGSPVRKGRPAQTNNLQVSFSADATSVLAGRSVGLSWVVRGAERVELSPGPGEVALVGNHQFSITEDTEFTLTARTGRRSISRVLNVGADPQVTLDYWLFAGEDTPTSRPRPPAGSPELPDHFGMLAGLPLTLHWRAHNATLVCLDGQALSGLSGTITLRPEGLTIYKLTSIGVGGDEARRSVTVKTFSPPVRSRPEPELQEKPTGPAGLLSWFKNFRP